MAYSKLNRDEGEVLSVADLNHMETQYDEFLTHYTGHNHDSRYYTESEADARFFDSGNDGPGSTLDADTVDGYTAAQIEALAIPMVCLGLWSGSEASIPEGFVLCDGANGTPDLQDKFIVGAGGSYSKGDTGGYASRTPTGTVTIATHALTIAEMPEHRHEYTDYYEISTVKCWYSSGFPGGYAADPSVTEHEKTTQYIGSGDPHGHDGSTIAFDAYDNRPPYHALCYIARSPS